MMQLLAGSYVLNIVKQPVIVLVTSHNYLDVPCTLLVENYCLPLPLLPCLF